METYKTRAKLSDSFKTWAESSEKLLNEDRKRLKKVEIAYEKECSQYKILETKLEASFREKEELQSKIVAKEESISHLNSEVSESNKDVAVLETKLEDYFKRYQNLNDQYDSLSNENILVKRALDSYRKLVSEKSISHE